MYLFFPVNTYCNSSGSCVTHRNAVCDVWCGTQAKAQSILPGQHMPPSFPTVSIWQGEGCVCVDGYFSTIFTIMVLNVLRMSRIEFNPPRISNMNVRIVD